MTDPFGSVEQLRQRMRAWRVAERREQSLRRQEGALGPAASLAAADDLYLLCRDALAHRDVVRSRELEKARKAWRTLRVRFERFAGAERTS